MLNDVIDGLLAAVHDLDPVARTIIAGLAIMLETSVLIGLLVPGDMVLLVASVGVQGPVEWVSMILVAVLGAMLGESFGFWLGHVFGPKLRTSWVGRKISEENWNRADAFLSRRGGVAVFVSRFLPVLHSVVPLVVGMSHMRYRVFIGWTLPACLVWATAWVSVAAGASTGYQAVSDTLHWAGYAFVGIIVMFLLVGWVAQKLVRRVFAKDLGDAPSDSASDDR